MKKRITMATLALAALGTLFGPAASARDRDDDHGGGYYGSTYERYGRSDQDSEAVRDARARNGQQHNYGYQNNPFYNNGRYDDSRYGSYDYGSANNNHRRYREDRESWRDDHRQRDRHGDRDDDRREDRDWRR